LEIVTTELAKRLEQELREGWSRSEIARKSKVSEGTIRNALEGKPLSREVLERLAKFYFKVPVDQMYRMAGILPPEPSQRAEVIRLIELLFEKLPASDQQEIVDIVRMKVERREKEQTG